MRALFCLSILIFAAGQASAANVITLDGDANGYFATAQTVTTPLTGVQGIPYNGEVVVSFSLPDRSRTFVFAAPNATAFAAGDYNGADSSPDPAPKVNTQNGCPSTAGWFRVSDLQFDSGGNPTSLAIDFVDRCIATDYPPGALYGAIRVNSTVPVDLSAPHAIPGPNRQVFRGSSITFDGSASFARGDGPLSFHWVQVSGTPASITGADTSIPTVQIPSTATGALGFQLTVSDTSGRSDTALVTALVASQAGATYVALQGEPGEMLLGDHAVSLDPGRDYFSTMGAADYFELQVGSATFWQFWFGAPSDTVLGLGVYSPAHRPVVPEGFNPGLGIFTATTICDPSTGSFDVLQLAATGGAPAGIAASFTYQCRPASAPALTGIVCENCQGAEFPGANAGAAISAPAQSRVVLDATNSFDPHGAPLRFHWRQLSGPSVTLDDPTGARPSFTTPASATSVPLTFGLVATNPLGYMSLGESSVAVGPPGTGSTGSGSGGGATDLWTLAGLVALIAVGSGTWRGLAVKRQRRQRGGAGCS